MEKKNQFKFLVAVTDGAGTNSVKSGLTTPRNNSFGARKDSRSKNINHFNRNYNDIPFYKNKNFSSNKTTPYNINANKCDLSYGEDRTSYNKNNSVYQNKFNNSFRNNNNNNYFRSKRNYSFNNNNGGDEEGCKSDDADKDDNFEQFSKFDEKIQGINDVNNINKNNNNKRNKKFTQSLNHMMNFRYTNQLSSREGNNRYNNQRKSNKSYGKNNRNKNFYNKETFLQANCKFVVTNKHQVPNESIEWASVLQVILQTREDISCPICLQSPVASQVTKCGHTYCFPCIFHYLSLSNKTWSKCPICSESITVSDLKSVKLEKVSGMKVGDEVVMKLMMRRKGSNLVTFVGEDDDDGGGCHDRDCQGGYGSKKSDKDDDGCGLVKDLEDVAIGDKNGDEDDITTDTTTGKNEQEKMSNEAKVQSKSLNKIGSEVINSKKETTSSVNNPGFHFDESSLVLVTDTKRSSHNKILRTTHNYTRECLQLQQEQLHVLMALAEPLEEPFIEMALKEVEKREKLYGVDREENIGDIDIKIIDTCNDNKIEDINNNINKNGEIICQSLDTKQTEAVVYSSAFDEEVDDASDDNSTSSNEYSKRQTTNDITTHITPTPTTGALLKTTTSHTSCSDRINNTGVHYFYQACDGQHTYLDPLNIRCLKHQYGHLHLCPPTIKGKILDIEEKSMNESLRDRSRYLEHVSLSSVIQFVHLHVLPPYLSNETLLKFKGEFDGRRKMRKKRKRLEGQRWKMLDEQEKKMMGMVTWGTIIKSDFKPHDVIILDDDCPALGTSALDDDVRVISPVSTSFAQMLKQGKQQIQHNIAWPKQQLATNKPSSVSSPSKRDEEEDEDDVGTAVPDFKESWLQGCSVLKLANDDARGGGEETNKGKKKKKKKNVLLFSTGSFPRV